MEGESRAHRRFLRADSLRRALAMLARASPMRRRLGGGFDWCSGVVVLSTVGAIRASLHRPAVRSAAGFRGLCDLRDLASPRQCKALRRAPIPIAAAVAAARPHRAVE